MKDYGKIAALLIIGYLVFCIGGIFVYYFLTGNAFTLRYSLSLPSGWITIFLGLFIARGLASHKKWAWKSGLIAGLFQLYITLVSAYNHLGQSFIAAIPRNIIILMLFSFIWILLKPQTIKQCNL